MSDQSAAMPADHPLADPVRASGSGIASRVARLDVHDNPAEARSAWDALEAVAPGSAYQSARWLIPWIETVGRPNGITPMIVVARASDDTPIALFPFGISRQGGLRIAHFLGGRDSNTNLGLIRPGTHWDRNDLLALLRAAAAQAPRKPDAFVLLNQPMQWEGVANPLARLAHQLSPSGSYAATLQPDGARFVETCLSGDARKKLRKKKKKLAEQGPVAHLVARTPDDVTRILDAFFAQKLERFRQLHISSDFETPETHAFLRRACMDGLAEGRPAIELHALTAGERVVAVYAGTPHRGRFHAMVNSFDPDPEIARTSPGDLLLMAMMETMCARGYAAFDLGIGEARYKAAWCDQAEPLIDTLVGVTLAGHAYAVYKSLRLKVKRTIKTNKRLWQIAQTVRAKFG